jgi:anti-sigma factor (TIGR02949 family)
MMSCEKVVQSVWEFLDRDMTPDTIAELQKHLDLCRSCFSRVEFEIALRENCRSKTNHTCPEKLKLRIRQIIELY